MPCRQFFGPATAIALAAITGVATAKPAQQPTLVSVGDEAKIRFSAQLPWRSVGQGREIRIGQQVRCNEGCELSWGSRARATLGPGATVRVLSPRFVRFDADHVVRCPSLAVLAGEVRVAAPSDLPTVVETKSSKLLAVRTGSTDLIADGSRLVVAPVDASVSLRQGREWKPLSGAPLFELGADGQVRAEQRLSSPAWRLGQAHRPLALAADEPSAEVSLAWREVADAAAYKIEIARDHRFGQMVTREQLRDRSTHRVTLPEGRYFARVSAADADGLWSAPTTVMPLQVVRVALPDGGEISGAGDLVLPPATSLRLLGHDVLDVAIHERGFSRARRELHFFPERAQRLRVRLRGQPDTESSFMVYERALRADVQVSPANPTWPDDSVDVRVRLVDPSGRTDPQSVKPRLKVVMGGRDLPVHFRFDGKAWVTSISGQPIGRPELMRLEVDDGAGQVLGERFVEVVARSASGKLARPSPRRVRNAARR